MLKSTEMAEGQDEVRKGETAIPCRIIKTSLHFEAGFSIGTRIPLAILILFIFGLKFFVPILGL